MELLKKGIVIGLGAHDMSKKQIEDFVKKLQTNKIISKDQYSELVNLIMDRKAKVNDHLNARIENFIKTQLKKEELATINHIEYLEKRIDLLEEEVYNLLLERYIEDVDDKEIADLLKDLDVDSNKAKTESKNDHFFDSDWLDSEELYDDLIKSENSDLKDLLYLPKEEEGKMFGKKKKVVAKKAAPKKPAVKKKVAAKKPTVKKVAKKPVKKAAVKKPVAAKKPAVKKKKTTKKAKK